jgi:hypothetical protein
MEPATEQAGRPDDPRRATVFAFATDERTLTVFGDEQQAVAACEGFDVANGVWLFFGADGAPLDAVFSEPASQAGPIVSNGRYSLRPCTTATRIHLLQLLAQVKTVEGAGMACTAAVQRWLTSRSNDGPAVAQ